jgi:hypothetical protein
MFTEWGSWRHFEESLRAITLPVYGPDDDRYVQGSGNMMCENGMIWLLSTGVLPTALELSSP